MQNFISIIKSKFAGPDEHSDKNPFIVPLGHHYLSIRAHYDTGHITLYMASQISAPKTDASCLPTPPGIALLHLSWCLTMYQTNSPSNSQILALSLKHSDFISLLRQCQLSQGSDDDEYSINDTRVPFVQWQLERDPSLQLQPFKHRNLQIGIPAGKWAAFQETIVEVSDVTHIAKNFKNMLNLASDSKELSVGRLRELGVMPEERVYEVPRDVEKHLEMR